MQKAAFQHHSHIILLHFFIELFTGFQLLSFYRRMPSRTILSSVIEIGISYLDNDRGKDVSCLGMLMCPNNDFIKKERLRQVSILQCRRQK